MSADDAVLPAPGLLGLLEVLDRSGSTQQQLPVRHWPVTVGRALTADLVLADGHVAAEHLRIEAPVDGTAPGGLVVQVLDTVNGVRHGRAHHVRGSRFDWHAGEELILGHSRLRLRLADTALAPEQLLARFPWRNLTTTLVLLLAAIALGLFSVWQDNTELSRFVPNAGKSLGVLIGGLLLWTGLWALATKLFTGHPQFWRHLRIVLATFVVSVLVTSAVSVLAFAFSWAQLARFTAQLDWAVAAVGLCLQFWVLAPPRRRGFTRWVVAGFALLGIAAMVWNASKDNQKAPRLANLLPPSWRLVAPVPVSQWMQESQVLRQRLDARLQDADQDEQTDSGGDSDSDDADD
ncbi:FHA domain-containing protein [Rhodoferax sp.]|uniref:FHA domain-containing protein n=1 Tax=Rhodoferax sp. TaxID=50421 RepID=UPI00374C9EAE